MVSTFELSGNTVGVIIRSDIDMAVCKEIEELIINKFREYKKINFFFEIEKDRDISFKVFIKNMDFYLENSKRFHKIAVVTDKKWIKNIMEINALLVKAEVEVFSHQDRMEAIRWIAE